MSAAFFFGTEILGDFELVEELVIGEIAYCATQKSLGREVALKIIFSGPFALAKTACHGCACRSDLFFAVARIIKVDFLFLSLSSLLSAPSIE
ncbi:MAG: hypothetical protein HN758_12535 [Verrucomicrobia bacterium]|nr:hypothetical protein [Verrucomicrobiota bacterium]MBT4276880.1 hypothetical protein [Verrucomicrobiota bacterium]MBT5478821.1 hypothetical protein [Verrucomicrobiota bacterium]MBT6238822.1 hypothetical protein [Verrucomicrobiota bacterium]MBT7875249.1 hypothetical protein [Verrucomicrobiota bacterium]